MERARGQQEERQQEVNEIGEFQDRVFTCVDCGNEFTWSVGEQAFFQEKGLASEPKRCQDCRRARKVKATLDYSNQKEGSKK